MTHGTRGRTGADEYVRLPGLYRRWELEQVIEPGVETRIEEAGTASDGTALYAVYRREPGDREERGG